LALAGFVCRAAVSSIQEKGHPPQGDALGESAIFLNWAGITLFSKGKLQWWVNMIA
jgi:hypothetical protein